jgi:RNA polymerase sigma factor (TIGR02999 family)
MTEIPDKLGRIFSFWGVCTEGDACQKKKIISKSGPCMTEEAAYPIVERSYHPDETAVAEGLFESSYEVLLQIARTRRRRAGMGDTMQTEDILHESFLKLTGKTSWQSPVVFLRTVSLAMRQVIVDHARKRLTDKRGNGVLPVPLEEVEWAISEFSESPEEILMIADILDQLTLENPRWMRIVDARYFGGMTEAETGVALGLSERTVRRDWRAARDWIKLKMDVEHR